MSNVEFTIGTEDPEYFAEIFYKTHRDANRRLPSDKPPCVVPGIQGIDAPLTRRLQSLVDAVANISLCQRGNVAATTACLKDDKGTLETRLYIVFNREDDGAALRCPQHLEVVFNMLRQVPYKAIDGSPKVITNDLENHFIEICRVIHNYSFDIFARRVNKHSYMLSVIRGYIEQDQTPFSPEQRSTLLQFLKGVGAIIKDVDNAHTKRLPTISIKMLIKVHSYWTTHNLLPKDDHNVTLLDQADVWLANRYSIRFQLRRWALKIMSLVISANSLFALTQSSRLHRIIQGRFSVQVLPSPTTIPYFCELSSETMQEALDAARAETNHASATWVDDCDSYIAWLLEEQEVSNVVRWKPTVHAELAMVIAMAKDEVKDVLPYVGVSKLSCIMCNHYIDAFNKVTEQKISIKGCHGKAYPGWFWPSLPGHDEKLRPAFLRRMKKQLLDDMMQYAAERRLSDSTTGSGALPLEGDTTVDELEELYDAERPPA